MPVHLRHVAQQDAEAGDVLGVVLQHLRQEGFLLRLQIFFVVLVGFDDNRECLDDFQAIPFQTAAFHRVVGDEAHLLDTEVAQNLGTDAVVALIGFESQLEVGIDGVESLFLQVIGFELWHSWSGPLPSAALLRSSRLF